MRAGILAVQGDFAEHRAALERLGVSCIELRQEEDLKNQFDFLVLLGGESTTQGKLLRELNMLEPIKTKIQSGLPVLATCAGLILLAENISNDSHTYFGTLPVTVHRNAYGRQLGSFHINGKFGNLNDVPMTFIRAPYIEACSPEVTVLSNVDGNIVAVQYENQLAMSFHPELDEDTRVYQKFIEII